MPSSFEQARAAKVSIGNIIEDFILEAMREQATPGSTSVPLADYGLGIAEDGDVVVFVRTDDPMLIHRLPPVINGVFVAVEPYNPDAPHLN